MKKSFSLRHRVRVQDASAQCSADMTVLSSYAASHRKDRKEHLQCSVLTC